MRLQLDPDYSRASVSVNKKMRVFAQKLHQGSDFRPMTTAATIPRRVTILGDGEVLYEDQDNYSSFLRIPVSGLHRTISVILDEAPVGEEIRVYACEVR